MRAKKQSGKTPVRAAVYLRVSTDRQDEANQEPATLAVCEQRGWQPVIYRERVSGVAAVRPEWDRLREDARTGELGAVVVYSIHRIGRKRTQIAAELADLARWGVSLVSVRERFLDVDNSAELARMRDMLIQWFAWFAEAERDEIVDRSRMAEARIRAELERNGQYTSTRTGRTITNVGRPGFGRRWRERAREIAVAEPKASYREMARRLAAEGCPAHAVTVRDWTLDLRRPVAVAKEVRP